METIMVNLSALYLSLKRLSEILDGRALPINSDIGAVRQVTSDGLVRTALVYALETAALAWLRKENPLSLGELLCCGSVRPGSLFTHVAAFYGKGIAEATAKYDDRKSLKSVPYLWTKLDTFVPSATLHVQVHPENLTSSSAPGELAGRKRLFLFARMVEATPPKFRAQAYVIGHLYDEDRPAGLMIDTLGRLQWQMELFPSLIDNFNRIEGCNPPTQEQLAGLERIPEKDIKTAFAEIIGESFVLKDWGGEKSDLFSTRVRVGGKPLATAFVFKGPAAFKPLTMSQLGKNGDQISRLFSEPADLLVLQHCHDITSAVRDHMRAFATRIGNLRPFTLIDGADTVRILRAYKKCGL